MKSRDSKSFRSATLQQHFKWTSVYHRYDDAMAMWSSKDFLLLLLTPSFFGWGQDNYSGDLWGCFLNIHIATTLASAMPIFMIFTSRLRKHQLNWEKHRQLAWQVVQLERLFTAICNADHLLMRRSLDIKLHMIKMQNNHRPLTSMM